MRALAPTHSATAEPPLPPPLTKAEKVELVRAHQAKHGGDFLAVYKALGFDTLHPHEQALHDVAALQAQHRHDKAHAQVAAAQRFAAAHRVDFIEAVKALGISA